ncbi:hypothetical protein FQN54_003226 [Arachnomyces sp. PD_36]|nr:hypothetical protein FQN54_003226 [Arachnomyces sp. PD_36]
MSSIAICDFETTQLCAPNEKPGGDQIPGRKSGKTQSIVPLNTEEFYPSLYSSFSGVWMLVGPMQEVLPRISERFDRIVCYQAINFVNKFELSLVLSRCFQLALKSVTIGVDETPDEFNTRVREMKPPASFLISTNHIHEIRDFGVPRGWKLTLEERHFGWTSPNVGVDVYTTVFHYERVE